MCNDTCISPSLSHIVVNGNIPLWENKALKNAVWWFGVHLHLVYLHTEKLCFDYGKETLAFLKRILSLTLKHLCTIKRAIGNRPLKLLPYWWLKLLHISHLLTSKEKGFVPDCKCIVQNIHFQHKDKKVIRTRKKILKAFLTAFFFYIEY